MDKSLRNALIAGITIITISIGYYLVIFLPKKENTRLLEQRQERELKEQKEQAEKNELAKKELEAKQIKCAEDAKKFHQEYIKSINGFYMEPAYHYNNAIEKCLYSGGYREKQLISLNDKSYWERVVKDVYTNESVLSAWNFFTTEQLEDFWKKHNELMNN